MANQIPLPVKPQKAAPRVFATPDLTDRSEGSPAYKAWSKYLYDRGEAYMRPVDAGWNPPADWVFWSDGNWFSTAELNAAGWSFNGAGWVHEYDEPNYQNALKLWELQTANIMAINAGEVLAESNADGRISTAINGVAGVRGSAKVKKILLFSEARDLLPNPGQVPETSEPETPVVDAGESLIKSSKPLTPEERAARGYTLKSSLGGR